MEVDSLRRFVFEDEPVRGHWLRLQESWEHALAHQQYGPEVRRLLGEAMGAAALLAASLKFDGTLSLQIAGDGPLKMLVAQSTHDLGVRAVARLREGVVVDGFGFRELLGPAQLTVTVDPNGGRGTAWQGVVPLEGDSLASCLEAYFATSEQLPTRVALAADEHRVGGLLLQKMPAPSRAGEAAEGRVRELWDEAVMMMQTVTDRELLEAAPESLLSPLFGGRDLRLFSSQPVRFQCRCSAARVTGMLRSLGEEEVRGILAEQGAITVTCEFCQRPWRFDAVDVEQLFRPGAPGEGPTSLN